LREWHGTRGAGRGGAGRSSSDHPLLIATADQPGSSPCLGSLIPPSPPNAPSSPRFDAFVIPDEFVVRYGSPCGPIAWSSEPRGASYRGCAATSPCCCADLYGGTPACAFSNCRGYSGTYYCPAGAGAGTSPQFTIPPTGGGPGVATTTIYVTAYGLCAETSARGRCLWVVLAWVGVLHARACVRACARACQGVVLLLCVCLCT
jgi:hypothetical protein